MYPNLLEWTHRYYLSSYHVFMFAGYLAVVAAVVWLRPAGFKLGRAEVFAAGTVYFVTGLAGARILHILLHSGKGEGFAYFGSWLGIAGVFVYTRLKKASFLEFMDFVAPFVMLHQAFVRIGCFLNGCCYGRRSDLPWAVIFPAVDNVPRHPTQVYEAIALLLLFVMLRRLYAAKKALQGQTFLYMLLLYGLARFMIEFLRVDSPFILPGLKLSQAFCGLVILASAAGLAIVHAKK